MKNHNKNHSILEVVLMVLALLFTAIGCERRLTKSPESAKQIKSLHDAAADGDIEQVKLLISKGADVNAEDEEKKTPLHYAAKSGKMELVQLLVEAGAEVNAGKNDWPPLCIAVYEDNIALAEYLIAHGADVKAPVGWTPLQEAACYSSVEMVELLIDKGADINSGTWTALLYGAVRHGRKDVAELLVARGADINAKDKEGHTPLYIALHHDYKVAELLIDKGADGNIKTESGQTLLQLAQERKSIESTVPDMIFDGEPNSAFGSGIACGDVDGDGYDDIVVGGREYNNKRGRAYLFYGGPDMNTTCDLIFEGETEGDLFGGPVSCGDIDKDGYDDIVIGAPYYNNQRGRVYLYWGSKRNSMDANADKVYDPESKSRHCFGMCIGCIDQNKDGFDDILIGGQLYQRGQGRVYLFYGGTRANLDIAPDKIFDGEIANSDYGWFFVCGDIDGDNQVDIVIGADRIRNAFGRVYVYWGSELSGPSMKPGRIFTGENPREWFSNLMGCGDVNNDGFDDLIIGAYGYKAGSNQGRGYLYYGGPRKE